MAVTYDAVEKKYKAKNKAIDQQTSAQGNAYDAQREDVKDNTTSTLQQLYLQREREKLNRGQAQKAAGITGGAAASAEIAASANYNTNRTNAMLDRDKQLSDINIQQGQAKAEAEIAKAQNNIEMETGRLSFNQTEQLNRRNELLEIVKAGGVTQAIADELEYPLASLKLLAERYKTEG